MKKALTRAAPKDDRMRTEYDFRGGVRGKHYRAMQAGYTITIRKEDGTTVVKEVKPREGAVRTASARKAQGVVTRRWVTSGPRSRPRKRV
jgi:hypothetical protein